MEKEKLIIKYFLGNIFEAKSHYTEWKMILHARSIGVVTKEMAERYTAIQKQAGSFFTLTERDVRSDQKPDSLPNRHLQMTLGFGQFRDTVKGRRTSWLMILEML